MSQVQQAEASGASTMAAEGIPGNVSGALLPTVGADLTSALTSWRTAAEDYAKGLERAASQFVSDEATRTAAITAVDRRMK